MEYRKQLSDRLRSAVRLAPQLAGLLTETADFLDDGRRWHPVTERQNICEYMKQRRIEGD